MENSVEKLSQLQFSERKKFYVILGKYISKQNKKFK